MYFLSFHIDNILLDDQMNVRICDFGLARYYSSYNEENNEKMTEYVVTRWYRAPEIILNPGHYGYEQDVWAAGCVFGDLIRRAPLFPGNSHIDQMRIIIRVMGNPSKEDLNFEMSPLSRRFLQQNTVDKYQGLHIALQNACLMHPNLLNLLLNMLQFNPKLRSKAKDCLYHPVFDEVKLLPTSSVKNKSFRLIGDEIENNGYSHPTSSSSPPTVSYTQQSLDSLFTIMNSVDIGEPLRGIIVKKHYELKNRLRRRVMNAYHDSVSGADQPTVGPVVITSVVNGVLTRTSLPVISSTPRSNLSYSRGNSSDMNGENRSSHGDDYQRVSTTESKRNESKRNEVESKRNETETRRIENEYKTTQMPSNSSSSPSSVGEYFLCSV